MLGQFSTLVISAQDRSTAITVGDVSGAGVTQVFVNEPSAGPTGRTVDLDARAGSGPSALSLEAFQHIYFDPSNPLQVIVDNALKLVNSTTGLITYLMGVAGDDVTTVHQHGGTLSVGQLIHDDGLVVFDVATRQVGQSETITMTTPAETAGNIISSHPYGAGDFAVDAIDYPTLVFHGLANGDTTTMNVTAPTIGTGTNFGFLDASTLVGALNVNALGDPFDASAITLIKAGTSAVVSIDGGTSDTNVQIGASRLSDIAHSVTVRNAVLTIDDSATLTPDISTLSASSFQWTIPTLGFSPTLTVSGLHGALTVKTGSGDQYDVEQTPPGITQLIFNNSQAAIQNVVYASGASSPIVLNGNFNLYLGWRLNLDGSVAQLNLLGGLPVSITENFSGTPTGNVVFDGDLDPAGASYLIDGVGGLHVLNQTVGLEVTINGYRDQDQLHIHLPGGSVQANLTQTGPGTITVDGSARAAGTNPLAVNNITVDSRGGNITLDPAGNERSVLHLFDTLDVAGNLPQDDLTVNVPTQTNVTNTFTIDASQLRGTLHVNVVDPLAQILSPYGLSTVILAAVNPLLAVFIIGTDPFPGSANYQVAQTTVDFGTGQLARIQSNVAISKAVLNIDDSTAAQPSNLQLNATTFSNWVIPATSLTPALTYLGLYDVLTVYAGAGDQLELDHAPESISAIALNNATSTQDAVYASDWSVPITANGNWSVYLGRYLHADGSVVRTKSLTGLPIAVTLNFSGSPIGHVILDGDADPAGAQYTIDGNGNLHVVNQTVGLSVTINGYRDQDELYIYLPGATVAANLQRTGAGTIYLDGQSRLAGTNPTAANDITVEARYGQTELVPVGDHNSLLDMLNDVYLLGSMPQDSLVVNVPTNVRITPAAPNALDLTSNPTTWAEVDAARTDALIAWKEGPWGSFTPFGPSAPFGTVGDASAWWSSASPWPNPYVLPYGVDVPYEDAPLSVGYFFMQPDGSITSTIYSGTGRYFIVDPHPVAVDNEVQLDASQLRGNFHFNITGPDYNYVENLARNSFQAFPNSYTYNYFHTWGSAYDQMRIAFGQSRVMLTHVNPELSVQINSENQDFAYPDGTFPPNFGPPKQVVVSDYPVTALNVGSGLLANIQGNLSVQGVALTVDNSAGVTPNNLILTGTTLTGWSTADGLTQPVLTMSAMENRPLTLVGGPLDRFGVEGTPATAGPTTIRNLATSGPTAAVYVMGKSPNRAKYRRQL